MNRKIIPLNLPAGLDREIAGNPVTTRLESAPANCFPGLDMDIRNLDRRFFPGLIFSFSPLVVDGPGKGARLVDTDLSDPDLVDKELIQHVIELSKMLPEPILLGAVEAGGIRVELKDSKGQIFDWDAAWRTVRSLEAGPVTIELERLKGAGRAHLMTLKGQRRVYQNAAGELTDALLPGELTQSLCSPWQHDFRDCSCTYWASNHPDIVLAAHPADIAELGLPGAAQDRAEDPIIWMRWDRETPVAGRLNRDASWALEIDHYEMNQRWRELSFVLEGREQPGPWKPANLPPAEPLDGNELLETLERLAGVEQALALEYLYARYTTNYYGKLATEEKNHAEFIAHELLNVAISEMMHLRWVNELLRELRGIVREPFVPVLRVASEVPAGAPANTALQPAKFYEVHWRPVAQRTIRDAIDDFVAAEAPSGTLDGQYARVLARLELGWPETGDVRPDLVGLVGRIVADGVGHYSRFREIQAILRRPGERNLVKDLTPLASGSQEFAEAEHLYETVVNSVTKIFDSAASASAYVKEAADAMKQLDTFARTQAERDFAVPFLTIALNVAKRLPSLPKDYRR